MRTATVALPAVAAATYAVVEKVRIRRVPRLPEVAGQLDLVVKPGLAEPDRPTPSGGCSEPLSMVALGDSVASGVGASIAARSWPAVLAQLAATSLGRPVHVRSLGRTGARAEDVRADQVPRLAELGHIDVLVLSVGANDATHLTPPERFTAQLRALCEEAGAITAAPVLLTGVPEFRCARAIGLPLRTLAWLCGQRVHDRQRELAEESPGVEFVDVLDDVSADFRQDPGLVAHDGYHPSDRGAARLAEAIVPALERLLADPAGSPRADRPVREPVSRRAASHRRGAPRSHRSGPRSG